MSEQEILNNEGVETLSEVSYSNGNVLGKVIIVGAVVALGITAVLYIKKKRAAKNTVVSEPVVVDEDEM